MYMQRSLRFYNINTPDDGPRSAKSTREPWKVYSPIPARYHKINAVTRKDEYKNVLTNVVYIV